MDAPGAAFLCVVRPRWRLVSRAIQIAEFADVSRETRQIRS
jgi:hypothetical protein